MVISISHNKEVTIRNIGHNFGIEHFASCDCCAEIFGEDTDFLPKTYQWSGLECCWVWNSVPQKLGTTSTLNTFSYTTCSQNWSSGLKCFCVQKSGLCPKRLAQLRHKHFSWCECCAESFGHWFLRKNGSIVKFRGFLSPKPRRSRKAQHNFDIKVPIAVVVPSPSSTTLKLWRLKSFDSWLLRYRGFFNLFQQHLALVDDFAGQE